MLESDIKGENVTFNTLRAFYEASDYTAISSYVGQSLLSSEKAQLSVRTHFLLIITFLEEGGIYVNWYPSNTYHSEYASHAYANLSLHLESGLTLQPLQLIKGKH